MSARRERVIVRRNVEVASVPAGSSAKLASVELTQATISPP